ncbi:MAG: MinD/ParA family protein [Planctomycetota bacterium]
MSQENRLRDWVQAGERESGARVIAVSGGKGGVGKTNLSVALGLTAASQGRETMLLDGDLGLANIDVLFDLELERDLSHVLAGRATLDEILVDLPFGLTLVPGASGMTQMADLPDADPEALERTLCGLEDRAELILVDTGAGINREVVEFCVHAGEVLIVTTPEPTAITDAYALIKVLAEREPGLRLWLVVNMARNRAEGDATVSRVQEVARRFLGVSVQSAGVVLADPAVTDAVRDRQPFTLAHPHSEAHACVRSMAQTLGFDRPFRGQSSKFFRRMKSLFVSTPGAEPDEAGGSSW